MDSTPLKLSPKILSDNPKSDLLNEEGTPFFQFRYWQKDNFYYLPQYTVYCFGVEQVAPNPNYFYYYAYVHNTQFLFPIVAGILEDAWSDFSQINWVLATPKRIGFVYYKCVNGFGKTDIQQTDVPDALGYMPYNFIPYPGDQNPPPIDILSNLQWVGYGQWPELSNTDPAGEWTSLNADKRERVQRRVRKYFESVTRAYSENPNDKVLIEAYIGEPDPSDLPVDQGNPNTDPNTYQNTLGGEETYSGQDFPQTEGLHMVFFDGHSYYIPNGSSVNPTRTRWANDLLYQNKVIQNNSRRQILILNSVVDLTGATNFILPSYAFVAYGKQYEYERVSNLIIVPTSDRNKKNKLMNTKMDTFFSTKMPVIFRFINTVSEAEELGKRLEKIDLIGQVKRVIS